MTTVRGPENGTRRVALWLAFASLLSSPVFAQDELSAPMDEVVVSGEFPGPGMWKVTRANGDGHVLWIVSDPPPLPKRMKWKSKDVEAVAIGAQEILRDSGVSMQPDEKIGFFRGITLLPVARREAITASCSGLASM